MNHGPLELGCIITNSFSYRNCDLSRDSLQGVFLAAEFFKKYDFYVYKLERMHYYTLDRKRNMNTNTFYFSLSLLSSSLLLSNDKGTAVD